MESQKTGLGRCCWVEVVLFLPEVVKDLQDAIYTGESVPHSSVIALNSKFSPSEFSGTSTHFKFSKHLIGFG